MTDDELDALIKDVAIKHGIGLSRDDPILITQTLNKHLMKSNISAMEDMMENFRQEIEMGITKWSDTSRINAEHVMNASIHSSKAITNQFIENAVNAIENELEKKINIAQTRILDVSRPIKLISVLNILASFVTLLAVFILFYAKYA